MYKYYFYKVLDKLNILKRINVVTTKKNRALAVKIPIYKRLGLYNLITTEVWMIDIVRKIDTLYKGIFLDIGVNIGQTLLKVKEVNFNFSYIGFEPNPECIVYVNELIKLNNFESTIVFPVGLGEKNQILTLYSDNYAASGASVIKKFRKDEKKYLKYAQKVPIFIGDDIVYDQNIENPISIIKIDVEGGELEVLLGLKQTLIRHSPFIICEILPVYDLNEENGVFRKKRQDELLNYIIGIGYVIFRISHENQRLTKLKWIELHGDMSLVDYIFVHHSRLEKFEEIFKIS